MINKDDVLWDATFIPGRQSGLTQALLRRVSAKRQADFVAFALKVIADHRQLSQETKFIDKFQEFTSLPREDIARAVDKPPFVIWLRQAVKHLSDADSLRLFLQRFSVAGSSEESKNATLQVGDDLVKIERFDLPKDVTELAAPEYTLPDSIRQEEFERNVYYPDTLFCHMIQVVLERIRLSWPEAYSDFPKFVHVIVDMIDGAHTSISGSDYPGIIFVSTDNSPIVGLEEFVIHEFGHQILYRVMELDDVVLRDHTQVFKLPWSGNERFAYGYVHAFYIYTLMSHYLRRTKYRSRREQDRIEKRIQHVTHGLGQAALELDKSDCFTPYGRQLFENLTGEIDVY